ncbi:MAG TPA: multicopper oxidase domain-containing protein [Longimicrobiales bacterium]|nr:multicopper oxidase domain-containing protein [Longimicrobiales bacterium]
MAALHPLPAHAQALPTAEPNDQRTPAGRLVDGELRIELEAAEAAWYPRGTDGPRVVTPAFAEVGAAPQVPGPLIRASAGTPVHVTIRNTLDRPIAVRGLLDRASLASGDAPPRPGPFPAFAFAEPLVIPPGETRETRFTPTSDVSSFYYGQRPPPGVGAEAAPPFGTLEEGAFMGAVVVDPAGGPTPSAERVLMITRWNSITEGGTQKLTANGLSWPFTERLEYTVGDTVRWRVINASNLDHPMHLHGFYFTVDALGDTQADTTYAAGARPLVVTQMMDEFSAMRLTWVPEQPGNWLFHCHLVRHMAFPQRFASEGPPGPPAQEHGDGHRMDNMAGLITGITVHPPAGAEEPEEAPVRRIDLWTGERPDVYEGDPELGFVVQEGPEPPAPDSTRVPGSPLVLTRDEPTEIVVHNRLGIPLSVHWHGLELRSVYDGVGGWSGYPGAVRPPIEPGDSVRVLITPPRAGSFMYHIHGEPGHELSQGLYGPFLVLEPGEERDPDADRIYTLADRGATGDAAPAINGQTRPGPQRFQPGRTYRLRFLHISADAFKRVRLLRDGEPVRWRPIAKDGADLPETARALRPAALGIGVGETYDVTWQPEEPGVYVLEVTTEFFPALGGTVVQRVAFGVGDVAESELLRSQQPPVAVAALPPAERARYVGTFVGPQVVGAGDPTELALSVWEEQERLYATLLLPVGWDDDGAPEQLLPAGERTLAPGRDLDGLQHLFSERYHFREAGEGGLDHVDAEVGGQVVAKLARVPYLEFPEPRLRRFEGTYGTSEVVGSATVALADGVLTLVREGRRSQRLVPISSTRFAVEGESGMRVDFELEEGRAVGLTIVSPTGARIQLPAAASDTVHVPPSTREMEADRQSVLSARSDRRGLRPLPRVRVVFQLEEGEVVGYELRRAEGGAVLRHVPRIR